MPNELASRSFGKLDNDYQIENSVRELQHAIRVAELNYEIWWAYKGW